MENATTIAGICIACVLARLLLEFLGEALLQGLCYWTTRIIVPALTFGRIRVASLRNPKKNEVAGVQTLDEKRRVISVDWAIGVGMTIWLIGLGVLIAAALWWPGFASG